MPEQEESTPSPAQINRARYPSRADRAVSAAAWYLPEALGLLALLLLGGLTWTPLVVLAMLAMVVRVVYDPVRRRVHQRRARAATEQRHARHHEHSRADAKGDEGVAV